MRVVLDEGVPRQLVDALRRLGIPADRFRRDWGQIANGALIRAAEAEGYAVLLTDDKNIADQQSLSGRGIEVVALPLNRRSAILARVDDIADTIRRARAGEHVVIGLDGSRAAITRVAGRRVSRDLPPVRPFAPRS